MVKSFGEELEATDEQIIGEIEADNEKDFLKQIKKKNGNLLVELDLLERERVAKHICRKIDATKDNVKKMADKIDKYDETYRMVRKPVIGADESMPNYVSPLSTVITDVLHANIMNVFFTPKEPMRVLPTEEGDIPKVQKLTTFATWSMNNEMDLFTGIDRMFHATEKNGETPYIVHWVKEYGIDIKREMVMNPADPREPLYDPDTKEPIFQEIEDPKLLYNAPKLEILSRRDYFRAPNAVGDKTPEYEGRNINISFDEYFKDELQGKMYKDSIKDITDWGGDEDLTDEDRQQDFEGDDIPIGKHNKIFKEFYGRLRIKTIKSRKNEAGEDEEFFDELEDEFIAIVNVEDQVLCSLRKNKFPLKMRPIGMDKFMADDEGRAESIGVMEFLENLQSGYDALFNQFVLGTINSNNPIIFFEPASNIRREPMKIQNGYMYPTKNAQSMQFLQIPQPNESIQVALNLIDRWSQLMFGISSFSAGVESTIDPDAPAKKAEILVAQGNVRLNAVIKRKNRTLKDIYKRWYLLYKENMPQNKFMRVAGEGADPWAFSPITLEDFSLQSIPDFELTGNILNANKALEAQKAVAIYNILVKNPFFLPQTPRGAQALHALTKWLIEKLDSTGLDNFLPSAPGETVNTPEEENSRFMQGEQGEPTSGEDHLRHIQVHVELIDGNTTLPDGVREIVMQHIQETMKKFKEDQEAQAVQQQLGAQSGQPTGPAGQTGTGSP